MYLILLIMFDVLKSIAYYLIVLTLLEDTISRITRLGDYEKKILKLQICRITFKIWNFIPRWEGHTYTGHNSPLYVRPESGELDSESPGFQFNTNFSVNYWLQLGAKRETVKNLKVFFCFVRKFWWVIGFFVNIDFDEAFLASTYYYSMLWYFATFDVEEFDTVTSFQLNFP